MSPTPRFWTRLQQLGLVTGDPDDALPWKWSQSDFRALLILADAQQLRGGLSLALNVRPDECMGPICQRMGVPQLKILDVRDSSDSPNDEGSITLDLLIEGEERRWQVRDVRTLVESLNETFCPAPSIRLCAVLGEWKDALHLWFGARLQLQTLLLEPWFQPENKPALLAHLDSIWSR